jgi:trigger factor
MSITETLNEGLKRSYTVVVGASELASKLEAEVGKMAPQVKMPGFRPGKVPANLIKKMHGPALEGQVLESSIQDVTQKILTDYKIRPAMQPKIDVKNYGPDKDLEFSIAVEILPDVPPVSLDGISLERLIAPVSDADVQDSVERLVSSQKSWEAADAKHAAKSGEAVVIDFIGKVDGVAFDGGTGEAMQVELGSGQLIPGFEDQMIGLKAGDEKLINVTFPADYQSNELKGKAATFDISVKEVKLSKPMEINDEMAKSFGLESLDKLKEILKTQVEREHEGLSRTYVKRKLLDALAAQHDFAVPEGMVEAEFEQIWSQLQTEVGEDEAEKAKLEAEKDDYRNIAVRRVRLGLLLSEIGQSNNVQITQAEMNQLIAREAVKYPGQQKEVVKYFQDNQMAAAQLRAPLYEEKVVDYILSKITVTEKTVTKADIEAAIQDESDIKPADAATPKKTKKPKAEDSPSQTEVA